MTPWTEEEFYEHNGGVDKLFSKHLTKERKRLLDLFKTDTITIKQIKLFKQRIITITLLMKLYNLGIKKNSRREKQIEKILKRYNKID
jgi:uncharacterized protein YjcR